MLQKELKIPYLGQIYNAKRLVGCFLETGGKEGRKRKRAPAERKLSAGARLLSPTSLFSISEG